MKKKLGRTLFWLTWPGIWLVLYFSRNRSRVVILHKDEILFVQDFLGAGRWKFPGGGIKRGEDPLIGAVRELKEETGLMVKPEDLHFEAIAPTKENKITLNIHIYSYNLKTKPIFKPNTEIADFRWIKRQDLKKYHFSSVTKAALFATIKDDYQKVF